MADLEGTDPSATSTRGSSIVPDDKDWTWVLDRPCPECGFRADATSSTHVADLVRANAGEWRRLHDQNEIRPGRIDTSRWSSLEYACHVRDVFVLYLDRIDLMLDGDDPLYPNWDQDVTAVADRYDEQDPEVVVTQLRAAADDLAHRLDGLTARQWERPGRRSDGACFTVDTIARYMIHDPVHHLWDVDGGGESLRSG